MSPSCFCSSHGRATGSASSSFGCRPNAGGRISVPRLLLPSTTPATRVSRRLLGSSSPQGAATSRMVIRTGSARDGSSFLREPRAMRLQPQTRQGSRPLPAHPDNGVRWSDAQMDRAVSPDPSLSLDLHSSNGKTPDSESGNLGSIPRWRALRKPRPGRLHQEVAEC